MKKKIFPIKNGASTDSILLTFVKLVTFFTSMLTTKILSVSLSLYDYGTYSSVILITGSLTSFTLLGLGDAINYFYNNNDSCKADERESFINTIYLIQLFVGIFAGLLLLAFAGSVSNYFGNKSVKSLLYIVCLKPMFENIIHLYQVLFISVNKAKIIAVRNFLISILRIFVVIISLNVFNELYLVFVLLVILDIFQIIVFEMMFGKIEFNIRPWRLSLKKITPILKYGLPMGVFLITNTLMRSTDKLIIGYFSTTENLALYSNCSKPLPFDIIITSFATVLVPYIMKYISNNEKEKLISLFRSYISLGYLSMWLMAVGAIVVSNEIIPFLYADIYLEGRNIFIIYLVDTMLKFSSIHLIIAASGESKYLMKISVITLILNIILSIVFYFIFDAFGIPQCGPALATVTVSAIYTFIIINKTRNILSVRTTDILPLKDMGKYLMQIAVIALIMILLRYGLYLLNINKYIVMFIILFLFYGIGLLVRIKDYKKILMNINRYKLT